MTVVLSSCDSTVNLELSEDGLTAQPLFSDALGSFWAGSRGNAGALNGKLYFHVEILKELADDADACEVLIGLSTRNSDVAQLGTGSSYALSSHAEKWSAAKSEAYGKVFGVGDKVGCYLDLDSDVCTLSFTVNGAWLGPAYELPRPARTQTALLPHILLKNTKVKVDFSGESGDVSQPAETSGYEPWMAAAVADKPAPTSKEASDCEVLMMVGLPGCGKSTWAGRYKANHTEKQYILLSIDGLIKQLKVGHVKQRGKPKPADADAQQTAEQAFEELLDHIQGVPANYIIDDSNVYEERRSDRVLKFRTAGFHTRCAVIVLPDSSLFRRQRKQHQEEGKSVPEATIADMRANFSMPEVGDVFQEVFFVEAKPPEAHDIAAAQAEAAREALPKLRARASSRQTRSKAAKSPSKAAPPAKITRNSATKTTITAAQAALTESKHTPDEVQTPPTSGNADVPVKDEPSAGDIPVKDEPAASDLPSAVSPVKGAAQSTAEDSKQDAAPEVKLEDRAAALDSPADSKKGATIAAAAAAEDIVLAESPSSVKPEQSEAADEVVLSPVATDPASPVKAAQTEEAVIMPADHPAATPDAAAREVVSTQAGATAHQVEAAPQSAVEQEVQQSPEQTETAADGTEDAAEPMDTDAAAVSTSDELKPSLAEAASKTDIAEVGGQMAEAVKAAADELVNSDTAAPAAADIAGATPAATNTAKPAEADTAAETDGAIAAAKADTGTAAKTDKATAAKADSATPMVTDLGTVSLNGKPHADIDSLTANTASVAGKALDAGVKSGADTAHANSPAGPSKSLVKEEGKKGQAEKEKSAEPETRGIKRPAAAIALKGAKLARTSQAAGRLLGNIRAATTVKRTIFKGRTGVKLAGLRLPPPIQTAGASVAEPVKNALDSKQAPKAGDIADSRQSPKAGGAVDSKEKEKAPEEKVSAVKGANALQSVMHQLLPVEEDKAKLLPVEEDKAKPTQASSKTPSAGSGKQDAKEGLDSKPSISSQKKAQGSRGAPASRPNDRRQQDRRPHDGSRAQQDSRQRGRPALPPPVHNRRHSAAAAPNNRHAGKDSRPLRQAPLGPRNAGVQKVQGRPRNDPPHDRSARHTSGPAVGHGHAPPPRSGPTSRNAPHLRNAPPPRHGPPPAPRRASYPPGPADRGPPPGRASMNAPSLQQRQGPRAGGLPPQHRPNARDAAPPALARGQPSLGPPPAARGPSSNKGPPPSRVPPINRGPPAPLAGPPYVAPPANPRSRGAGLSSDLSRAPPSGSRRGGPPGPRQTPHGAPQAVPRGALGARSRTDYPPAAPLHRSAAAAAFPPATRDAPRGPGVSRAGPLRGPANSPRFNQRQQPGAHRSPLAPAPQLPNPRADSVRDPTPQGGSRTPRGGPQHDRPRSQSRGRQPPPPSAYSQGTQAPQQYSRRDIGSVAGNVPMQYEPALYAPEPRTDPYGPPSGGRGPPQPSWHDGAQDMDYQQIPPPQQAWAGDGQDAYASRRTDRHPRNAARNQQVDDHMAPPASSGRYPGPRADQVHMDQGYGTPDVYASRGAPPSRRSHGYADQAPLGRAPPADTLPPLQRYSDSPAYSYGEPAPAEPQQPVYGSGPPAPQGYSTAPPSSSGRQGYYPPQQQHSRQVPSPAPLQYSDAPPQYSDAPQYGQQSSYAPAGPSQPQYGYDSNPAVEAPRGSYAQPAARSAPRQRNEPSSYGGAYPGTNASRGQSYSVQQGQPGNAPGAIYGAGGLDSQAQAWAPAPREAAYGGAPQRTEAYAPSGRSQAGYAPSSGYASGSGRQAPQGGYVQQTGGGSRAMQSHGYSR